MIFKKNMLQMTNHSLCTFSVVGFQAYILSLLLHPLASSTSSTHLAVSDKRLMRLVWTAENCTICNKWWSWWYMTGFGGDQNADMPLLTSFPSTALEGQGRSLQTTAFKQEYFMLRLSVARLPGMQLVILTSLCLFLKIKHSPGCSW